MNFHNQFSNQTSSQIQSMVWIGCLLLNRRLLIGHWIIVFHHQLANAASRVVRNIFHTNKQKKCSINIHLSYYIDMKYKQFTLLKLDRYLLVVFWLWIWHNSLVSLAIQVGFWFALKSRVVPSCLFLCNKNATIRILCCKDAFFFIQLKI